MLAYFPCLTLQDGDTAIHFAAEGGNKNMVDLLLNHGADINATNKVWTSNFINKFCENNFCIS